uniref:ABC transporter permease n=1 Tax=Salidesulfovibrio brasiliensis TaxID=221711 RepID=UPI000A441CE0
PVTRGGDDAPARGVVGLSHLEPEVTGLDRILVKGRWFREGETGVVLLPERIADELGVDPEDPQRNEVIVWGYRLKVTGVFSDTGLRDHPDLDGEPITPIVYPNEAAARLSDVEAEAIDEGEEVVSYESRYRHIPGYETIIIPSEALLSLGGGAGKLKGIAVKPLTPDMPGGELGDRFGMMLFRGGPDGTSLFYTADAVSYGGVANILIPVLISILIVLNTMIGSVYERKGEIAVYTSIGLAPPHVAFLFIAESLAFAVISVVFGYLLAQGAAAFLAGTPLWAGMTANYSSTAGVAAMLLVIAVALVSSIYPAKVAARIAIPDVNRSWTMPEPKGDTLTVVLPFLIKLHEQFSAGGFLREYYLAHEDVSHGAFSTESVECTFVDRDQSMFRDDSILAGLTGDQLDRDDFCFDMNLRAWLAPFDFGVRQKVHLIFCPSDVYKGFRQVRVTITREAGEAKAWQNLNRTFINDLRKQLLAWRSLDDEAVESYAGDLKTHIDETLMNKAFKEDRA